MTHFFALLSVFFGNLSGNIADSSYVSGTFVDTNGFAGIEQVERVRCGQHLLVRRQCQAEFDQALALFFGVIERAEQGVNFGLDYRF